MNPWSSRITHALRSVLGSPMARWVAQAPDGRYYDGFSGVPLTWHEEAGFGSDTTAAPEDVPHSAFRRAERDQGTQILVDLKVLNPADTGLRLGRSVEFLSRTLAGSVPALWGTGESATLAWETADLTALARKHAPESSWFLFPGPPNVLCAEPVRSFATPLPQGFRAGYRRGMVIPGDEEIRALHERYAPTRKAFALVHTHCEIVCTIAEQLIDRSNLALDRDLVRAGCLLHDIGVYRLYDSSGRLDHARYVSHGVRGHEVLALEGLPEALCRFCSHHTGVGLTREDIRDQGLPVPEADYLADSVEEELVMYADKFHSKRNPPVFVSADSYAVSVARFGEEKVTRFKELRARFGTPDLAPLASAHGHALV